jgi:proteasome lid subunit RPN8/RPN11/uncharacterized membrane protein YqjE
VKGDKPADDVKAGRPSERSRPAFRKFEGPRQPGVLVRVGMTRKAYAEVTLHAKESLQAEICGVLAGRVLEDDEGRHVSVDAAVRGTAARQERAHVTFTQETWNGIHERMDREHPDLAIVGWYHSHPGFGVAFSEMDAFIQKNFFGEATQVGLVIDPLGGDVALAANEGGGLSYLPRFWVEGREHRARVPSPSGETADAPATSSRGLADLETRLSQVLDALEKQKRALDRLVLVAGMVFGLALLGLVGWRVYSDWASRWEPPRLQSFVPVPVTVGGRSVILGVAVVDWELSPEKAEAYRKLIEKSGLEQGGRALQELLRIQEEMRRSPAPAPPGR